MKMEGRQIVCKSLIREGCNTIFGIPGGAILPLYQALPEFPELRHILTRHEQGASHAADAYARVTGKAGVAFATSGPGATNLVTGIATAQMDSVPMVFITGQVSDKHQHQITEYANALRLMSKSNIESILIYTSPNIKIVQV